MFIISMHLVSTGFSMWGIMLTKSPSDSLRRGSILVLSSEQWNAPVEWLRTFLTWRVLVGTACKVESSLRRGLWAQLREVWSLPPCKSWCISSCEQAEYYSESSRSSNTMESRVEPWLHSSECTLEVLSLWSLAGTELNSSSKVLGCSTPI